MTPHVPAPGAFLDRDGVLNVDSGYVHRIEDLVWIAGAKDAVRRLKAAGFRIVVVTNQAGIARGLYGEDDVRRLHAWMNGELGQAIDAFYYCPHHPTAGSGPYTRACACRKPEPGMIRRGFAEHAITPAGSFLIGDRDSDIEAARRAGIRGVPFDGGNLDEAVAAILAGGIAAS